MQSDRFVFAPPPLTDAVPSLGVQTAETLGPGMPSIKDWTAAPSALPLLGADGYWKRGSLSFELTDALIAGTRGDQRPFDDGLRRPWIVETSDRFSVQVAHLWTTGDPILTTTFFGVDQEIHYGNQGRLYTSELANQEQTISGARAFFHPLKGWDALAELGRARGTTPDW